jgi:hypothetical protein
MVLGIMMAQVPVVEVVEILLVVEVVELLLAEILNTHWMW